MEDQIYVLPEEWISYLPFQRRVLATRRQTFWSIPFIFTKTITTWLLNGKYIAVDVCVEGGEDPYLYERKVVDSYVKVFTWIMDFMCCLKNGSNIHQFKLKNL